MTKMLMGEHPYLDIRSFGQEVKSVLYRKYEQLRKEKGTAAAADFQRRAKGELDRWEFNEEAGRTYLLPFPFDIDSGSSAEEVRRWTPFRDDEEDGPPEPPEQEEPMGKGNGNDGNGNGKGERKRCGVNQEDDGHSTGRKHLKISASAIQADDPPQPDSVFAYSPASPAYSPTSPAYSPASPAFSASSPDNGAVQHAS